MTRDKVVCGYFVCVCFYVFMIICRSSEMKR